MDSTPFYGERGPIPFFLGRKSSVCKKRLWTKWFYILSQPLFLVRSLLCRSADLGVLADECFDVGEMRILAELVGFIGDEQAAGVQGDFGIRDAAE